MKPIRTHVVHGLLTLSALLLVGAMTVACASDNPPNATANLVEATDQSPSAENNNTEPSIATRIAVGVHPSDLRTRITGLDPVLEAIASGDPAAIAARLRLLETPCTTADGLGGPPKCDEGMAEGTVVSVFPVLGAEGAFVTADDLLGVAEGLDIAGLFGIYQVTGDPSPEEAYWPSGDYGVVLAGAGDTPAYTLLVQQGDIVRIIYHFGNSPEEAFDSGRGVILVPPLQ